MRPDRDWQLIGTFWPLVGFALLAIAGVLARGATRWWILLLGPLAVLAPCFVYAREIAYDGNMLFAVIFLLSALGLMFYYPVLLVVWIVLRLKARDARV
jgi:hypothetical protein